MIHVLATDFAPLLLAVLALIAGFWRIERRAQLERRDRSLHLQFQEEFRILSKIWAAVARFEASVRALRPYIELLSEGQTEVERHKENLVENREARADLISAFTESKPFYSAEIFKALQPIIRVAEEEFWDAAFWGPSCTNHDDPEKAMAEKDDRLNRISDAADRISEAIRARVLTRE